MIARLVVCVAMTWFATANAQPENPPRKGSKDAELLELTNDPLLNNADRVIGEETRGYVAFTFDDGPNPETTPAVIDALLEYDIPATFFIVTRHITGKRADLGREILKRELDNGFLVGSHTVSHRNLRGASSSKLAAEVDESLRILSAAAKRPIGLFRAPFGAVDKHTRAWLKKRRLTETFWSIDTRDWQAKDPELLRHKIMRFIRTQEGGVVLMHDVKEITAQITAAVLDDLEAENCKRLGENRAPIYPVSIHYFLHDHKKPRAIPDDVQKRTDAYKSALPGRCAMRAKSEPHDAPITAGMPSTAWSTTPIAPAWITAPPAPTDVGSPSTTAGVPPMPLAPPPTQSPTPPSPTPSAPTPPTAPIPASSVPRSSLPAPTSAAPSPPAPTPPVPRSAPASAPPSPLAATPSVPAPAPTSVPRSSPSPAPTSARTPASSVPSSATPAAVSRTPSALSAPPSTTMRPSTASATISTRPDAKR